MTSWELTSGEIREIKADALENGTPLPEERISGAYLDWVKTKNYAILERKADGQLYPALQSKRGNSRYAKIHQKKLQNILCRFYDFANTTEFSFTEPDDERRGGSCVLFLTLNFNPGELSKAEAWSRVRSEVDEVTGRITGSSMHLFVANLHKIFRRYWEASGAAKEFLTSNIVTQCTIESHESGYPHIHMTMILDRTLPVFLKESRSNPGKFFWRLRDYSLVKEIKRTWARCAVGKYAQDSREAVSFCDIQAAVGDRILDDEGNYCSALAYCLKYQTKTANLHERKDILTHAYCKFWNTRSIIGKRYLERIGAYYRGGITRHDELINDLQLRLAELRDLNEQLDQYRDAPALFFGVGDPEIEGLRWQYVKTRLAVGYILNELERLRDWKYLGTVTFGPEDDTSGFWEDIKAANSVAARMGVY